MCASARDEETTASSSAARFALAAAASLVIALPSVAAIPVAQVALSVDEQIASEIAKYDEMKASCKNEACRTTTQSWEDAAVKKIKKQNGVAIEKPKASYPAPKAAQTTRAAPAAVVETPVAPVEAPAPKAEIPVADAKAAAKAQLAERQAASAAAAEAASAEKAAKAAAAKKAAEEESAAKAAALKAQQAARSAPAPAPAAAPVAKKAVPAPEPKKAQKPEPKKSVPKKSKSPSPLDAAVGDVTIMALAGAAGIALAKPSVKDKALSGDVAEALEEAKAYVAGSEGVVGKAAAAGAMVAVDALAHLPLLGFLLPGPLEYVGACAATLLAARYYVTKDATLEEDLAAWTRRLPGDMLAAEDVTVPAAAAAAKVSDFVSAFDLTETKGDITEWFNGLDDPVETIAPPLASLFVANVIVYAAHFPALSLFAPRALELAGVACGIAAVEKYGNTSSKFQEDLGRYAIRGGDAIKALIEK